MTLYTERSRNVSKTWLLMFAFTALLVLCAYAISLYRNIDPLTALAFGLGLSVVSGFTSYFYSDRIALSVSRARETKREEYTELYRIVENLSITAGIQAPRIYVIEDSAPNAFATGRNEKHSAIAVTTGLLKILDRSELEGVIAHELAHIGNRDILIMSVAVVLAGSVSILADFFLRTGLGGRRKDSNSGNGGGFLAIVGLVLIILAPLFAMLLRLAVSRKREFVADATAGLITRYPDGLAHALQKISAHHTPMANVHDATAHLFISDPHGTAAFDGKQKKKSLLATLFSTHPPVEARITALMGQGRA